MMKWIGRGALLAFMALAIASPAGVAECSGEYGEEKREPAPTQLESTKWTNAMACSSCHGFRWGGSW